MWLLTVGTLAPGAFAPAPQYATGRTAHVNLSTLATFGPSFIARESSVVAEIAWNRALSTDDPDNFALRHSGLGELREGIARMKSLFGGAQSLTLAHR